MASVTKEVLLVIKWVKAGNAPARKTINKTITSYGLKHFVERKMGQYICNESFVEAMLRLGYKGQRIKDSENYFFNVKTPKE
jgi:hypothetical protein